MTTTISEFLVNPQTQISGIYGHYCSVFKIKNRLSADSRIRFDFQELFAAQHVGFIFDYNEKTITDFFVVDSKDQLAKELTSDDEKLIVEVLEIYLARIEKEVSRLTKEMRSDWGSEFKKEILNRSGFTSYFSELSENIERKCKLNIFTYTLSNKAKKNLSPFESR